MRVWVSGFLFGTILCNFLLAVAGILEPRQAGFNAVCVFVGGLAIYGLVRFVRKLRQPKR